MPKLKKPKIQIKRFYDYNDCSEYLEQKYNCDFRDYGGRSNFYKNTVLAVSQKFNDESWQTVRPCDATPNQLDALSYYDELMENEPEYLDFWHFILDCCPGIGNGSDFTMSISWMDINDKDSWQNKILQLFFDEFDPKKTGEIEFNVCW